VGRVDWSPFTKLTHDVFPYFLLHSIQMPVMDGFEATRRIRRLGYTRLPVIGLTASVGRSDFAELGFNDWLPKPTRMNELKAKLYRQFKATRLQES
jgi:CheY-like chemotaxis protein